MLVLWLKKTDYDAKISDLATNSSLTAVENKIPDITSLVTKIDFDAKLKDISDRVTKNKSKDLLLDNELKKLKTFDTDYFEGKNYFEGDDGTQNTLVFQVKSIYFRHDTGGKTVGGLVIYPYDIWKSKGSFDQSLYYSLNTVAVATKLIRRTHVVLGTDEYFQGVNEITTNNSIVNISIVYKLSLKSITTNNALKICLFGAIKASRPNDTTDSDKYIYSEYGIGFDHTSVFTHPESNLARNIIIFGADMSRSVYASNKTQNILVLGKKLLFKK